MPSVLSDAFFLVRNTISCQGLISAFKHISTIINDYNPKLPTTKFLAFKSEEKQ